MQDVAYQATGPLKFSGEQYEKGQAVTGLDEKTAQELLKFGAIEVVETKPAEPAAPDANQQGASELTPPAADATSQPPVPPAAPAAQLPPPAPQAPVVPPAAPVNQANPEGLTAEQLEIRRTAEQVQ